MKYIEYREQIQHGTLHFPVAYYRENPHAPRYMMQHHWHKEYELVRITSGTFQLTVNNRPVSCRAGDIILITGGFLHGGVPQDCCYECVVFDLQFLLQSVHTGSKVLQDIIDHRFIIHTRLSDHSDSVAPVVGGICAALASRQDGYELLTLGYLYQLIGVILGEHLYEEASEDAASLERLNSIKSVLAYIAKNYSGSITLGELAAIAGMNPKYFCRYFRNMTKRTPIDYLNYYRIECACEMLMAKDISVKEAAFSCGFNDESYFIKIFHKYKGITPKQYMTASF